MKKVLFAVIGAVAVCAISACSNTGYTKVATPDGTTVVHGHVDKGTTVTKDANGNMSIDTNKGPEQQYQVPTTPTSTAQ